MEGVHKEREAGRKKVKRKGRTDVKREKEIKGVRNVEINWGGEGLVGKNRGCKLLMKGFK